MNGARFSSVGTVIEVSGVAPKLTAPNPGRAGQTIQLDVTGPVGSSAFLLVSLVHHPFFEQACHATIDPDLATSLTFPLGVLSTGQLSVPLSIPNPLGLSSANQYLQTAMIQGNDCFAGGTSSLLVLDAGY